MGYRLTAEEKARRAERRANVVNPYRVGDVVVTTWGYEQTNASFYEVVGVTAKACRLRELEHDDTEARPQSMSGHATPRRNEYRSEPFLARLAPHWREGEAPYVNTPHGSASLWDDRPVPVSWYG